MTAFSSLRDGYKGLAFLVLGSAVLLLANSAVAQTTVSYPNFSTTPGLTLNGSASAPVGDGQVLRLTPTAEYQAGSAWYSTLTGDIQSPVPLAKGFTSAFAFQISNLGIDPGLVQFNLKPGADGIAFLVQNAGTTALGAVGGSIGYTGITNSVAVQFDTWCNPGPEPSYGDTCASGASPTSGDEISVQSCGPNANTADHNALTGPGNVTCTFGRVDLSTLRNPIYISDGQVHNAQITYSPPSSTDGNCSPGSQFGSLFCGSLTVILDGRTVLAVPFSLAYLGLDGNSDAFVGFTGATGAAFEDGDILNWSFTYGSASAVTQPFNASGATTTVFNSNAGNLVQQTIDTSNAGPLTCNTPDGTVDCTGSKNIELSSTNMTVSNPPPVILLAAVANAAVPGDPPFPPFVTGTPWSSALCAGRPGDGGTGALCSLYVNACYGGPANIAQAQASDFYCPYVNTATNQSGFFVLKDTWDPLNPKPTVVPGTTVSLLDFVPTSPVEVWTGSNTPLNPVCTQVAPINGGAAAQCDVSDSATDVYGDQTTTRGTKPKKGWLISLFNVQMLLTTVQAVSGPGCTSPHSPLNDANPADPNFENPLFGQSIYNNGNCLLAFTVNPAQAPNPNTNNFVAAPPASLFYGVGPAPAVGPGPVPGLFEPTLMNPNPYCQGAGLACNAQPWQTGGLHTLSTIFGAKDGSFLLFWAAKDAASILEKSVKLDNTLGDVCPNPENPASPVPEPCYDTTYFTTIVNIDSTPPTVSLTFSPAGGTYALGQAVTASFTCTDPMMGGVASGIASCVASVDGGPATGANPVPLNTATAGAHTVTVKAVDNAGNSTSQVFNYTVLPDADVAIFEQHTSDKVKPGGTLTYLAWALDLSKTSAAEVTVTEQLQLPASGVNLGNVTASVAIVSCTLAGCTAMPPSGGAACTVTGTTISCNIGTLPSLWGWKGALIKTSIPVLATSKVGTAFKLTATVNSPGDPNPGNNSTTDYLSICSPE